MSTSSSSPSGPARWQKLGQTTKLTTPIFTFDQARFRHPGRGTERDFVVINSPDWVNVVALTTDERLVLVRQFRYGANAFSLEIPGGVMDQGEDPLVAGQRELREETGFAGGRATLLGSVHPNPAIQSNRAHFILVEDVRSAHAQAWDVDEEIEVVIEPVERVFALARDGGITHALVLNALLFFEPWWRARRKSP